MLLALAPLLSAGSAPSAPEKLSRGVVALPISGGGHFVSWRLLGTDRGSVAFNLYQQIGNESPTLLNEKPISGATNHVVAEDLAAEGARYLVRSVIDGKEGELSAPAAIWSDGFLEIPVKPIDGYRVGDASIGDLDGDGNYDLVVQQSGRARDNSHSGLTDSPILDAYKFDGTHLWRIDLGKNIRDGEHYTQFMVFDLDGDGRAEVACKTADGSTDGRGKVIGDPSKDWRDLNERSRSFGRVLDGPEFLTVFDGMTGAALQTVDYEPGRHPIDGWGGIGGNSNNDNYGNRCDRFLACVAYLDGKKPSLVMCRGVYGRTVLVAWDWRGGKLTKRWTFDSGVSYPPFREASPYSGMGGHSLSVADVDADGRDEIVYQAMVVDDDGEGLHSSGLRHGDALHVSDFNPARAGLEILTVQENEGGRHARTTPGAALRDAKSGEILWSHSVGIDISLGMAADIDPRYAGAEIWGGPGGLRTVTGKQIGPAPRTTGFAIWWDGDLLRELLTTSRVTKWNWTEGREDQLLRLRERGRWGGRNPTLVADLIGDWREEVIVPGPDNRSLRLYSTPIPTSHRLRTLMNDRQYRLSIAWQNVAYNKPPHPSFFLGHGMESRPADIGRGE